MSAFFFRCHRRTDGPRGLYPSIRCEAAVLFVFIAASPYTRTSFLFCSALFFLELILLWVFGLFCAASDRLFIRRHRLRFPNTYFRVGFCMRRMCSNMSSWEKNVDEALYGCDFSRLESATCRSLIECCVYNLTNLTLVHIQKCPFNVLLVQ